MSVCPSVVGPACSPTERERERGGATSHGLEVDGLDLRVLQQAVRAQLAALPAHLEATERRGGVKGVKAGGGMRTRSINGKGTEKKTIVSNRRIKERQEGRADSPVDPNGARAHIVRL